VASTVITPEETDTVLPPAMAVLIVVVILAMSILHYGTAPVTPG
jgi:hypothetical protein